VVRGKVEFLGLQNVFSRTFVELHYNNCLFLGIAILPV